MKKMKTISELHQAIEKSEGKNVHLKLRGLDQSKALLNGNYVWLLRLEKSASENIELFYLKNRDRMDSFQLEFARLLHNYLASVKSLVDHTRTLKRKLRLNESFEVQYNNKRESLLGTDSIVFVQQLREYVQHYSLLPSGIQLQVLEGGNSEKISLTLDTKTLLEFSKWKAESLRILRKNPEKIDIFKMLDEYQVSVNKFYQWFYKEIEEIFKKELKDFDELVKEYVLYYEKIKQKTNTKSSKFGQWDAPAIEDEIVCISNDYVLSSQISACFNNTNVYFAVFEPPRSLHKYWENEFVKLNNVLAKLHPSKVIFINVESEMISRIKAQLRLKESRYEYISNQTEVDTYVDKFKSFFKGVLECPPDRRKIAYALLRAKQEKLRLIIKEKAQFDIQKTNRIRKHIIVSVTLANYAFSIDADIFFLETSISYKPEEIYSILSDTRGTNQRAVLANSIVKDIGSALKTELDSLSHYEIATFFTDDFPYGYFFPDIPTTHVFNKLLPSHFIADSIVSPYIQVQSAVLVDSGFFQDSETNEISSLLSQSGVHIKELRDDKFSNADLDSTVQHFPYDLLFVCSHGDFPSGVRFKIHFSDKNKCEHIITIDTLDEFNPTNKGTGKNQLIGIKTFIEFVELDGQPWYQKKYKKGSSKTVVEDFLALDRNDWKVLGKENVIMNYCNVIVTNDPISPNYIPMIQSVSDPQSAPFIFNNACVSSYTMSNNIIFAGASFYVGTIKPVKDDVAIKTAKQYFEKSVKLNKSLALSLWEALKDANIPKEDRVYTCIGCHFKKFVFDPSEDNKKVLRQRIQVDIALRLRRIFGDYIESDMMEKHSDIVGFLLAEYSRI